VGTAVIAAVGIGLYPDFPTAVGRMTSMQSRLEPDPARAALYAQQYQRYRTLFSRVKDLF
jgi:ribulose kinase